MTFQNGSTVRDVVNLERGRLSWWERDSVWDEPKFLMCVITKVKQRVRDLGVASRESMGLAVKSKTFRNLGLVALVVELIGLPVLAIYADPRPIGVGLYGCLLGYTGIFARSQHIQMRFYETLSERLI